MWPWDNDDQDGARSVRPRLVVDITRNKGDLHPLPGAKAQLEQVDGLLHGTCAMPIVVLDVVLVPVGEVQGIEEHALGHKQWNRH